MPIWNLTEKQTRILQSTGIVLFGLAGFILVILLVYREFWIDEPLICGNIVLPKEGNCPKTVPTTLRIESGTLGPIEAMDNSSCRKNRGHIDRHVQFEKAFTEPPNVFVSLTKIDYVIDGWKNSRPNKNLRIKVNIVPESITNHGFNYNLNTWCDTAIAEAQASWIAYGR